MQYYLINEDDWKATSQYLQDYGILYSQCAKANTYELLESDIGFYIYHD